jgi:hypothetical protein
MKYAKSEWEKTTTYQRSPFKIVEQADIGRWWVYRGMKLVNSQPRTLQEAQEWCDETARKERL